MGFVTLARGFKRSWAWLYRAKLVRAHMPFWRVVVEAKVDRRARRWPLHADSVVTAVFVWAPAIEEAEALAMLALEAEGLIALTADAYKSPPGAAPRREPGAVARNEFRFLTGSGEEFGAGGSFRRGARA